MSLPEEIDKRIETYYFNVFVYQDNNVIRSARSSLESQSVLFKHEVADNAVWRKRLNFKFVILATLKAGCSAFQCRL